VAGEPRDAARMIDPIHQFNIDKIFTIGHIGNQEIAFTNSSAYMFVSVALISLLMIGGVAGRQLVPGRIQSVAELSYEFVANTIRSSAGSEGMKFFPLVFSLFMFIMVSNMIGIIPYTFTVSSHIIVTASLALLVFFTVLVYGFYKNGLRFFKQDVRAVGHSDRDPAAGGADRDHLVPVAADFTQRPSVRQHAGRPHYA
jgi:F-type H+-transporting ATPase subunit a